MSDIYGPSFAPSQHLSDFVKQGASRSWFCETKSMILAAVLILFVAGTIGFGIYVTINIENNKKDLEEKVTNLEEESLPVRFATNADETFDNLATVTAVNGQDLVDGDRLLLTAQVDSSENGIYVYNVGVGLTRQPDPKLGVMILVNEGDFANIAFLVRTTGVINQRLQNQEAADSKDRTLMNQDFTLFFEPTTVTILTNPAPVVYPISEKGQIFIHDGQNPQALDVGSNNQMLTANSATDTGLEWRNGFTPNQVAQLNRISEDNIDSLVGLNQGLSTTDDVTFNSLTVTSGLTLDDVVVAPTTLTVTSSLTLDDTMSDLFVNSTSGNIILTLPLASSKPGRQYFVNHAVGGNACILSVQGTDTFYPSGTSKTLELGNHVLLKAGSQNEWRSL